jgi:hypothetical protein
MELIFEIVVELLLLLVQLVGEVAVGLMAQSTVDVIGQGVRKEVRRGRQARLPPVERVQVRDTRTETGRGEPVDVMLMACAYVAAGWLAGMLSLLLMPDVFIKVQWLRVAGLILVPLASASLMYLVGLWRKRHDKHVSGLETFSYGFCFAFMVSVVRFIWGHVA